MTSPGSDGELYLPRTVLNASAKDLKFTKRNASVMITPAAASQKITAKASNPPILILKKIRSTKGLVIFPNHASIFWSRLSVATSAAAAHPAIENHASKTVRKPVSLFLQN